MIYGQHSSTAHLTASAANFETEIMRYVPDQGARNAARAALAEALRIAIAGTVTTDAPRRGVT